MHPGRTGKRAKKAPIPRESGASSIESLPDGVLQHILGFLPARDALRSCVLARRWRHFWMFATGLHITGNGDVDDMEELREFVDHLLLLRGIAPLETCELRFTDMVDTFSEGDTLRVNLWFLNAVRCQARVLRLVMPSDSWFDLNNLHLVSWHLMHLELSGVEVKENFLKLSECPALEQLEIDNCDLYFVKKISSESLKRLSVTSCAFRQSFRARIHAPSLVSLLLHDNWFNTPVLESMPSLMDASIRIAQNSVVSCDNCDRGDSNSSHGIIHSNSNCILFDGLSKATNLALIAESKTFIFKMDLKRCPTFSKLKTLLLSDYWCVALDLDAITCILKNSPLLEKLTFEHFLKGSQHEMEMRGSYIPVQRTDAISENLKIVAVKCDVADQKVYRVLKLLSTFNIHKLTSNSIRFLSIPKVLAPRS